MSDGTLTVTNAFTNGVVTVERAASLGGLWVPDKNVFSTGPVSQVSVTITGRAGFFRALAADLSGSNGFSNLTQAYGLLSTIAGSGASNCTPCNDWQSSFEGGPATNAALSHPHIAMADRAGNIYIPDKEADAIRKVTPDGTITTVAGTGPSGFSGDGGPATLARLSWPRGIAVDPAGNLLIADTANHRVRKVFGVAAPGLFNGQPFPR